MWKTWALDRSTLSRTAVRLRLVTSAGDFQCSRAGASAIMLWGWSWSSELGLSVSRVPGGKGGAPVPSARVSYTKKWSGPRHPSNGFVTRFGRQRASKGAKKLSFGGLEPGFFVQNLKSSDCATDSLFTMFFNENTLQNHLNIVKVCALHGILDVIAFCPLYLCFQLQLLSVWEQNRARQGLPGHHSRMKKYVQNALWKRARRPIEPLSAQIASKTAKMVPNGAKRALEMRQNHIQKGNHIVSKIMIARITIASILQTQFIDSFVEQRVRILHIQFRAWMFGQISTKTCFVAARAGKQTHFSRWGAFL